MPFGLTNAPASFQALMNNVFSSYLRKFVLVFFDDILVYSKCQDEHVEHLSLVLRLMKENELYAKLSKCLFEKEQLEYLGHIISKEGVSAEPTKIDSMLQWPKPRNLKDLRGFLGLTGYYRKFVRNYGIISKPLTNLLKKGQFEWIDTAEVAFNRLKQAMVTTHVLVMPNFRETFVIETDASDAGIGAVLTQNGKPVAYLSKALGPKNAVMSTYEREMLAIVTAVQKWRHYLGMNHFVIRTDHQALKYFLTQKVTTLLQQKWLTKLLGLDYEIQYKRGIENTAADSLSRRHNVDYCSELNSISQGLPTWVEEIQESLKGDSEAMQWVVQASTNIIGPKISYFQQGVLMYKGKFYVGSNGSWRQNMMEEMHSTYHGGHSGIDNTFSKFSQLFFWPAMREDIKMFVK